MRTRTWTLSPLYGDADSLSVHDGYGQIDPEPTLPNSYVDIGTPSKQCIELWITYSFENTTTVANPVGGLDVALASGVAEDSYHFIEDYVEPGIPGYFFIRGTGGYPDTAEYDYAADYVWGTRQRMHALFEGGRIRASRWLDGDDEPTAWMLTTGDLGHVYVDPVDRLMVDSWGGQTIRVYEVVVCPLISDTFQRTEREGWGRTTGNTDTAWAGDDDTKASISKGVGRVNLDIGSNFHQQYLGWTAPVHEPEPPLDIEYEVRLNRLPDGPDEVFGDLGEWLGLFVGDNSGGEPGHQDEGGKFQLAISGQTTTLRAWNWANPAVIDDEISVPTPVTVTEWFKVRFMRKDLSAACDVYIWKSTDDQPTTATLSLTADHFSNHATTFEVNCDNPSIAGLLVGYCRSLDVVGSESW